MLRAVLPVRLIRLFFHSAVLLSLTLTFGCRSSPDVDGPAIDTLAFVGRSVCADCHASESEAWVGSDHDLAMTRPTPETVLGDFDQASFAECGVETQFFTEGGGFFVRTQGRNGETTTYPVRYTFGHHPLQQYLLPTSGGRLQALSIAWDAVDERWFSLYPNDCFEPGDVLHWTGSGMTWNHMCADCHSTNLRRSFDLATETYSTSYSEVDVSCEACHGPGEQHVELVRTDSYRRPDERRPSVDERSHQQDAYFRATGLTVDLTTGESSREGLVQRSTHHAQVETCAPCHSRRRVIFPDYAAGKPFLDHYEPELLEDGLYFADGQVDDEVFVYGSFLQSRMYANGVRCADCHDPHTTELKLEGNALCGQCHEPAQYDVFTHLRHEAETAGSQCVDCHMPERTFMVIDPRRDHSFKIPRPDLSAELGTPNVCSGCHDDRSAGWAADAIAEWHGDERPASFARATAGGRAVDPDAEAELIRIVEQQEEAAIVRATAVALLDRYTTVRSRDTAVNALDDEDPLVRVAALRNLADADARPPVSQIERLLADSVRLVRIEAARALMHRVPGRYAASPESETSRAFWSALEEYRRGQLAQNDQAAAHLNLAVTHESVGELAQAEEAYRTAVRLDSSFVPAHLNLAMLYERRRADEIDAGRADSARAFFERAVEALARAVQIDSTAAQARYSLGLLLAEEPGRLEDAARHLTAAAQFDSTNARIAYNAGLAQQRLDRGQMAEPLLRRAHRLAPDHPDYIDALSIFYAQQERWQEALRFTDMLLQHFPNDPDLQQRRAYVLRGLQRSDRDGGRG